MDDNNLQNIIDLIKSGNKEQAKTLLMGIVDASLSEEEKGRILTALALMEVDGTNKLSQEYIGLLEKTLSEYKKFESLNREISDKIRIEEIKKEI